MRYEVLHVFGHRLELMNLENRSDVISVENTTGKPINEKQIVELVNGQLVVIG